MIKLLALFLPLTLATTAFASGGMIGGGDVNFRAILECEATGLDSTFSGPSYVWLTEEVDENGMRVANTNLRIVTLNSARRPISYYVTHQPNVRSLDLVNISVWRYEMGSSGNERLGVFQWNNAQGKGVFTVEELQISNCR